MPYAHGDPLASRYGIRLRDLLSLLCLCARSCAGDLMRATPPSHVQGHIIQTEGSRLQAFFSDSPHGNMTVSSHMTGHTSMAAHGHMAGAHATPATGNMAANTGIPAAGYMAGQNNMRGHALGVHPHPGYKRSQDVAGFSNPQPQREEKEEGTDEQLLKKCRWQ